MNADGAPLRWQVVAMISVPCCQRRVVISLPSQSRSDLDDDVRGGVDEIAWRERSKAAVIWCLKSEVPLAIRFFAVAIGGDCGRGGGQSVEEADGSSRDET